MPKGQIWIAQDFETLLMLYDQGHTVKTIAYVLGTTKTAVNHKLDSLNRPLLQRCRRHRYPLTSPSAAWLKEQQVLHAQKRQDHRGKAPPQAATFFDDPSFSLAHIINQGRALGLHIRVFSTEKTQVRYYEVRHHHQTHILTPGGAVTYVNKLRLRQGLPALIWDHV